MKGFRSLIPKSIQLTLDKHNCNGKNNLLDKDNKKEISYSYFLYS